MNLARLLSGTRRERSRMGAVLCRRAQHLPIGNVDALGRYMGDMLRPYRFKGVKVVAANHTFSGEASVEVNGILLRLIAGETCPYRRRLHGAWCMRPIVTWSTPETSSLWASRRWHGQDRSRISYRHFDSCWPCEPRSSCQGMDHWPPWQMCRCRSTTGIGFSQVCIQRPPSAWSGRRPACLQCQPHLAGVTRWTEKRSPRSATLPKVVSVQPVLRLCFAPPHIGQTRF